MPAAEKAGGPRALVSSLGCIVVAFHAVLFTVLVGAWLGNRLVDWLFGG